MTDAIRQVAYLISQCEFNRVDAVASAAQYFGINANTLYAAIEGKTLWSLCHV